MASAQIQYRHMTHPYMLPPQVKSVALGLAVSQMLLGLLGLIAGILGFTLYRSYMNIVILLGVDIWTCSFYLISGLLGMGLHINPANYRLMHAYFAFTIISFIVCVAQCTFSAISLFFYYVRYTFWHSLASLLIGMLEFGFSLGNIILLGHLVYCKSLQASATVVYPPNQQMLMQEYNSPSVEAVLSRTLAAETRISENFQPPPPPQPIPNNNIKDNDTPESKRHSRSRNSSIRQSSDEYSSSDTSEDIELASKHRSRRSGRSRRKHHRR
ncbi:hypothetical protein TrispH2_009799 [Trichoplax sp. H2]|uniref:Uncharacterized protein n=1 Tax=Trichoplax adhaerens TaxID=10228 RepID=B3SD30_TRIAD|nr:predicted protein [Trichoplax adhaerens]EDV19367.1 predicted protein [Trichoplax adhaerens]RDD38162.1 hypothetical protein TrispH2_009799 [Trichoplax sp. H2]|eukprot:XP_002118142.1 predicted protein [Trichoplax adhaerens]